MFRFPTMLGDWSIMLYAMSEDCADYQSCSETHQSSPVLCSGLASITLQPQIGDCFSSVTYELDSYTIEG